MGISQFVLTLFVTFITSGLSSVIGNDEVNALMEIKAGLDPGNKFLSSWVNEGDPCSGYSFVDVACNENGKVTNISLQGKGLSGGISSKFAELKSLTGLYLHYNALSGEIPKEIGNMTELVDLYLNVNNLTGIIPAEIGNMASLQVLQIGYNRLTGNVPTQLGSLKKLSVLALQCNQLTGAVPANLGELGGLMRLDLSFNHLFGSVPAKLADIPLLQILDVRNNTLSGNLSPALKRLKDGFHYGNNTDLCGVGFSLLQACSALNHPNSNLPEPFTPTSDGLESNGLPAKDIPESANIRSNCNGTHCSNQSKTPQLAIVIGVIVVIIAVVVTGLLTFSIYRRRKQKIGSTFDTSDSRLSTDQVKELNRKSASPLISLEYSNGWDPLADGRSGVGFSQEVLQSFRFNLEEVESATQYFSDVNLLGKSNFSATYKGILRDGSVVAVKSINKTSCKSEESEFLKGLNILTALRHENLVSLRGFCCSRGRGECFLVYSFVPNGKLSEYLDVKDNNERVLEWSTRLSIINGIAKGIEYLHSSKVNKPSLVHQNLSAEKILIDHKFNPMLSDSGLHKLLADDIVFSRLKATAAMGYLAPEYTNTGKFTEKSDVYAFGMIILQILSGKGKISNSMRIAAEACRFEDFMDSNLKGKFSTADASIITQIALTSTHDHPAQRPTMEMVIQELCKCSSNSKFSHDATALP